MTVILTIAEYAGAAVLGTFMFLMVAFGIAACMLSGRISREEERAEGDNILNFNSAPRVSVADAPDGARPMPFDAVRGFSFLRTVP